MAFLEIKNLSFTYSGAQKKALDGINLDIEKGEFILLCGKSGCGKSTLLRMLKRQLTPVGKTEGEVFFDGGLLSKLGERESVIRLGMVMQDPESQTVTEKVWHELAFGLESIGEDTGLIRRKTAEICGFLGIGELFGKNTSELSGGEKQLVCLASVLAMNPDVLLLDEPSGQLDPIAAENLILLLRKLALDNGITVILAEHRTENVFSLCDRVVFMDHGKIILDKTPKEISNAPVVTNSSENLFGFLPAPMRLFVRTNGIGKGPLSVRDGKKYVTENFSKTPPIEKTLQKSEKTLLSAENVYFRYSREGKDVLSNVSLSIHENEIFCILGENGSGKTTLLKLFAALKPPVSGKITFRGKNTAKLKNKELYQNGIAYLPQNPKYIFTESELKKDLLLSAVSAGGSAETAEKRTADISEKLGITDLLSMHPYDLSGGEAQKAAIARLLLSSPVILLLDEPSKGLDYYAKEELGKLLRELKKIGVTTVAVTHDTEFAAENADRCALLFNGSLMSVSDTNTFFSENNYYTTSFSKMTRDICKNAVTLDEATNICKKGC